MLKYIIWDFEGVLANTQRFDIFHLLRFLNSLGIVNILCTQCLYADGVKFLNENSLDHYFSGMVSPKTVDSIMDKGQLINGIIETILHPIHPEEVLFIDVDPASVESVRTQCKCRVLKVTDNAFTEVLSCLELDKIPWPLSKKDKERPKVYRAEFARYCAKIEYSEDSRKFLESLGLKAKTRLANKIDLNELTDFLKETSQFLAVSSHTTIDDMLLENRISRSQICVLEAEDKFGSYGVCGALGWRENKLANKLDIAFFGLSRRVQGRGLGTFFLHHAAEYFPCQGISFFWEETPYNSNTLRLWDWFGFHLGVRQDKVRYIVGSTEKLKVKEKCPYWISCMV